MSLRWLTYDFLLKYYLCITQALQSTCFESSDFVRFYVPTHVCLLQAAPLNDLVWNCPAFQKYDPVFCVEVPVVREIGPVFCRRAWPSGRMALFSAVGPGIQKEWPRFVKGLAFREIGSVFCRRAWLSESITPFSVQGHWWLGSSEILTLVLCGKAIGFRKEWSGYV